MKHFNALCLLCFSICAAIFTAKFCLKQTDHFSILAISSHRPYVPKFSTSSLTEEGKEEFKKALNQPYHYFGSGAQAYVFFSADGHYVIKFFKQRLFRPSWVLNYLPLPKIFSRYRDKNNHIRLSKWERDFYSYKIAFEELKAETGMVYAHLNPTTHLKTQLEISDRLGIRHLIDLDQFDFIVQTLAEKVYDRINRQMLDGNIQAAKESIAEVFSLMSARAKKGFHDRDPNIETNCGFAAAKAIKMDVGRFVKDEAMKTTEGHNQELLENTASFEKWIKNKYPELLSSYHELLQEALIR